ncbi:hypothetical protein CLMAG_26290 [Clostridium magnum DSM 2767]|uniref:Uncharacterized protein n=2 Tax=Clostridium magnum TaxID=33954 RepID=A0A162TM17_9CLOT|nr:hypothetical protein CLMAG_26290 [Clostridium magnum DSM 2767]SHI28569.1 Protein of unknown function [Clostridium magnum DSM 2767]
MPFIQKSVEDYFTKFLTDVPTVAPWNIDILRVEKPNAYRSFIFVLKIRIKPYVGQQSWIRCCLFKIAVHGEGDVEVNNFQHIKKY